MNAKEVHCPEERWLLFPEADTSNQKEIDEAHVYEICCQLRLCCQS